MATSYYSTGTVTLTNGSAVVTGVGTLWQTALITNGLVVVEAEGNILPILSVDTDTQITAELEWIGATGTYNYAILRQTEQMQDNAENSRALAYVISEIRNGTLFKYDAAGTLADRALYNERPKGFSYLVFAGTSAQLYVKASVTSGDWAGPYAYGAGPTGPMGPAGPLGPRGYQGWAIEPEVVSHGSRQALRVSDFIGGEGAKPSGVGLYVGNGGLVTDIEDAINIRGLEGPQGSRGVVWRGTWTTVDIYSTGDLVIADDAENNPATFIALTANANSEPISNPSDWGYFPASTPSTINDGIWGGAITETANDGVWGA